jgi:hypothetical protein
MNFSDKTLVKKLAVVVMIKLAVLMALWWVFVREKHFAVDGNSVAAQFLAPVSATAQGTKQ